MWNLDIKNASNEEKLWLETCIKVNKFIPFSEIKLINKKINYNYLVKIFKKYSII